MGTSWVVMFRGGGPGSRKAYIASVTAATGYPVSLRPRSIPLYNPTQVSPASTRSHSSQAQLARRCGWGSVDTHRYPTPTLSIEDNQPAAYGHGHGQERLYLCPPRLQASHRNGAGRTPSRQGGELLCVAGSQGSLTPAGGKGCEPI
jgi:hypothetical protein